MFDLHERQCHRCYDMMVRDRPLPSAASPEWDGALVCPSCGYDTYDWKYLEAKVQREKAERYRDPNKLCPCRVCSAMTERRERFVFYDAHWSRVFCGSASRLNRADTAARWSRPEAE